MQPACLAPLQAGVGISGGAEIPGHALYPDFHDPDVVTVQVDLRNAFNLFDRTAMLAAVAQHAPGPLPFVRMSYQQASALLLRRPDGAHELLWSETGV
eukprot:jgi/Ulvmu1/7305/UM035_0094.1